MVHADETSRWGGGPGWWLWVFTTPQQTYYVVIQSRAAAAVLAVLGSDFAGVLVSDCLNLYDDVKPRQHKSYSHPLKAVSEALEIVGADGSDSLLRVQVLLRTGILLKACHGPEPDAQFTTCVNALRTQAHGLLDTPRAEPAKEKVRMRLWKQRDHRFAVLEALAVPATTNLTERQLRPAVIARKLTCGNKTPAGAQARAALATLAATCGQTGQSFVALISQAMTLQPARGP